MRKSSNSFPLLLTAIICCFVSTSFYGQAQLKLILRNQSDSMAIPFAHVTLESSQQRSITNERGEVNFKVSALPLYDSLSISTLGFHGKICLSDTKDQPLDLFVPLARHTLAAVEINAYSARSVVEEAIRRIPGNHIDSSYFCHSFLRQYQKINGRLTNLVEARPIVAFNILPDDEGLQSIESFYLKTMRRTAYECPIKDLCKGSLADVLVQNPVYHRKAGALMLSALDLYYFVFDSISDSSSYRIRYSTDVSSENHGLANYNGSEFKGESRENGLIVIDKNSFAVKRYERRATRNQSYNYPKGNNFVHPSVQYTCEFVDADLVVEYAVNENLWAPVKICHRYTNEFFRVQTYEKQYRITDYYEWTAEKITKSVPQQIIGNFYFDLSPLRLQYIYDEKDWDSVPTYYFSEEKGIKEFLEKRKNLEKEFISEGEKNNRY
jgi:hypothetical protein